MQLPRNRDTARRRVGDDTGTTARRQSDSASLKATVSAPNPTQRVTTGRQPVGASHAPGAAAQPLATALTHTIHKYRVLQTNASDGQGHVRQHEGAEVARLRACATFRREKPRHASHTFEGWCGNVPSGVPRGGASCGEYPASTAPPQRPGHTRGSGQTGLRSTGRTGSGPWVAVRRSATGHTRPSPADAGTCHGR